LYIQLVTDEEEGCWDELYEALELGVDIETTGLDPHTCEIISVQVAHDDTCFILDFRKGSFPEFGNFLAEYTGTLIFHNAKFDLKFLYRHYGVFPLKIGDTFLAERLLSSGRYMPTRSAGLKAVTERRLGIAMDKGIVETFLQPLAMTLDFTQEQLDYAAQDALVLPKIYYEQLQELEETDQMDVYNLELDFVPVLVLTELTGIGLDIPAWTRLYHEAERKAKEYREALVTMSGNPDFNPNSPKQLIKVMYGLNIPVPVFKGRETTGEQHIAKLRHPFIKTLLVYRQQAKLVSTYGKDFLKNVNPITNRVHANFHQLGTETGRLSSAAPNMQNIPRDAEIRACFKAQTGYKIISADFSMQEIVVQAELSDDPELIKILNNGIDRHRATAAILFEVSYDDVTKEQRAKGKTFNFGIGYGSSAWNMANKLELPERLIEKALLTYWKTFEVLRKFNLRTGLIAFRDGYSSTALGRKRWYINMDKQRTMRLAANHVIQGTAADMTKFAAVLISNFIRENNIDAQIINFVHDEVEVEVLEEDAEALASMIETLMGRAGAKFVSKVTQGAEVKIGDTWQK